MSRINRIHNDYLDPDIHLWPDEEPDIGPDEDFPDETDPYGTCKWYIGDQYDFVCFDFSVSLDRRRIKLHSVLNSETGSFIQDFETHYVLLANAVGTAQSMIDHAYEWCYENDVVIDRDSNLAVFEGEVRKAVHREQCFLKKEAKKWR